MHRHSLALAVSAVLLAFAATAPVLGKDLYDGKTINFITDSAVGGSDDAYGRRLAVIEP